MHQPADFEILAESRNGYIGKCACCQEFNLAYKNIVLNFGEEEMYRFLEWLLEYKYLPQTYWPMPHGRDRVYRSPLSNLRLVFSLQELEELEKLFAEVQLMLEARKILAVKTS